MLMPPVVGYGYFLESPNNHKSGWPRRGAQHEDLSGPHKITGFTAAHMSYKQSEFPLSARTSQMSRFSTLQDNLISEEVSCVKEMDIQTCSLE